MSGFFGRLRNRRSTASEAKRPSFNVLSVSKGKETLPIESSFAGGSKLAGEKGQEDPSLVTSSARAGSDPTTVEARGRSTSPRVSGIEEDAGSVSPSSFRRGQSPADISSLSSSGLEEEDLERGRTGRVARTLDLGKAKPKEVEVKQGGQRVDTDSDDDAEEEDGQFEEARDTFDEGSAPAPAFTGQRKRSSSPAGRETKFTEEL